MTSPLTSTSRSRPVLTSLNGDSTWLISSPVPARNPGGKAYYHLVTDPWLNGPAGLISRWLVHVEHEKEPTFRNGADVDGVVRKLEAAADSDPALSATATVDAILISFHLFDHLHQPTLRTFAPGIPVFVTPEAAKIVRGWDYFTKVVAVNDLQLGVEYQATGIDFLQPGAPLPTWLSVFRLKGSADPNFAIALVWSSPEEGKREAILYAPHGVQTAQLETFLALCPRASLPILAILHPLKDGYAFFSTHVTHGVLSGLALARLVEPRYWITTHNSKVWYSGLLLILAMVRETMRTLEEGLDVETSKAGGEAMHERPNLVDVSMDDACVLA